MRIWLPNFVVDAIIGRAQKTPYFDLYHGDSLYMRRWWLRRPPGHGETESTYEKGVAGIGIRVHQTLRDDSERVLHCHPWLNISIVLRGGYFEVMPKDQDQPAELDHLGKHQIVKWRGPGSIVIRRATDRHRLMLPVGGASWSLFIMGPWQRDWGFHTAAGWVHWCKYLGIEKGEG